MSPSKRSAKARQQADQATKASRLSCPSRYIEGKNTRLGMKLIPRDDEQQPSRIPLLRRLSYPEVSVELVHVSGAGFGRELRQQGQKQGNWQ